MIRSDQELHEWGGEVIGGTNQWTKKKSGLNLFKVYYIRGGLGFPLLPTGWVRRRGWRSWRNRGRFCHAFPYVMYPRWGGKPSVAKNKARQMKRCRSVLPYHTILHPSLRTNRRCRFPSSPQSSCIARCKVISRGVGGIGLPSRDGCVDAVLLKMPRIRFAGRGAQAIRCRTALPAVVSRLWCFPEPWFLQSVGKEGRKKMMNRFFSSPPRKKIRIVQGSSKEKAKQRI